MGIFLILLISAAIGGLLRQMIGKMIDSIEPKPRRTFKTNKTAVIKMDRYDKARA